MKKAIQDFPSQFGYEPDIQNKEALKRFSKYVLVGMGGSGLVGRLINTFNPAIDLVVHSDYGLPSVLGKDTLVICSSYSGNTEEVIEAFKEATKQKLSLAVIATGGRLLDMAKAGNVPYIQLPDIGIQPRCAVGFSLRGVLKIMGEEEALKETAKLTNTLSPKALESEGKALAKKFFKKIPIIYASQKNLALAYIWKITFNETGKIPAFYNVFPELNHNEMTGFDVTDSTKELSENLQFLLLKDDKDQARVQKRMDVLYNMYKDRGLEIESVALRGNTMFERIFSSLLLADWTAYHLALLYKTEPDKVPMVEEFKRLIQ